MSVYRCDVCDKDLSSKASLAIFKMKFCNFGKSGESIPLQCSRELVCLAGCVGGSQSTTRKRKSSPTRKFKKARPTKQGSNHLRRRAALLRKETDAAEKEAAYKRKHRKMCRKNRNLSRIFESKSVNRIKWQASNHVCVLVYLSVSIFSSVLSSSTHLAVSISSSIPSSSILYLLLHCALVLSNAGLFIWINTF